MSSRQDDLLGSGVFDILNVGRHLRRRSKEQFFCSRADRASILLVFDHPFSHWGGSPHLIYMSSLLGLFSPKHPSLHRVSEPGSRYQGAVPSNPDGFYSNDARQSACVFISEPARHPSFYIACCSRRGFASTSLEKLAGIFEPANIIPAPVS